MWHGLNITSNLVCYLLLVSFGFFFCSFHAQQCLVSCVWVVFDYQLATSGFCIWFMVPLYYFCNIYTKIFYSSLSLRLNNDHIYIFGILFCMIGSIFLLIFFFFFFGLFLLFVPDIFFKLKIIFRNVSKALSHKS